ncbi:MAG TPA: peptidoglycan DD-metalloendopeptidase family protein [Cyclobacteriaceae bacterium]|jgi:septal ring factor EnvC (AmiA/AmiB activator)|nr:peptidoglycan DD-metalloendopeptidase family protein [Cyclobacteriaceae bacterium]
MTAGRNILALSFLFFFTSFFAVAQKKNKALLQRERQQNLEKIQETEKILEETEREKKSSLGELVALNKRISQQETLVHTIKDEIELLDADIDEDNQIIEALQRDVDQLKEEYSSMVFAAQKASGKTDKLMLLFASSSFDQLLMRLKYMNQYGKARQEQAAAIDKVQRLLGEQVKKTEAKRNEKQILLTDEVKQKENLAELKTKQRRVVRTLEKEEKRLKRDLDDTKKALNELDNLIAKIVKEEIERAAREARAREKSKVKEVAEAYETVALSTSFEENKRKFPWPVAGFVSQKFGRQMHPVLKGIEIQNDGINIQTKQNEPVRSVFNGEVRSIAFYPILGNAIIVSHGDYYSIYAGLKEVFVRTGQKIGTNEEIGRVRTRPDGISQLQFQLRKNTDALDPEQWLRN